MVVSPNEALPSPGASRIPADGRFHFTSSTRPAAKLADIIAHAGNHRLERLGVFEHAQFAGGTKMMASAIAHSETFSIAGGGDALAAIARIPYR